VLIKFLNGDLYEGGWGVNGDLVEGGWKEFDFCPQGKGVYQSRMVSHNTTNCVYEGDFVNGKMEGMGTLKSFAYTPPRDFTETLNVFYTQLRGEITVLEIYEGQFVNNLYEGFGKLAYGVTNPFIYDNKFTYSGQWKCGLYNGYGVLTKTRLQFNSRVKEEYKGHFAHGSKDGEGELVDHIPTPWKSIEQYVAIGTWKGEVLQEGGRVTCGPFTAICGEDYTSLLSHDYTRNVTLVKLYIIQTKIFATYKFNELAKIKAKASSTENPFLLRLCDYIQASLQLESSSDLETEHRSKHMMLRTYLLNQSPTVHFGVSWYLAGRSLQHNALRKSHRFLENEKMLDRMLIKISNKVFHKKYFDVVPFMEGPNGDFVYHETSDSTNEDLQTFEQNQPTFLLSTEMKDFVGNIFEFLDVDDKYRMLTTCRDIYNLRFRWNLCPAVMDVSLQKPSVAINMVSAASVGLKSLKLSHSFDDAVVLKCFNKVRHVMKVGSEVTNKKRKRGLPETPSVMMVPSKLEVLDVSDSKCTLKSIRHLASPLLHEFYSDNKRLDLKELHMCAPNIRKMRCSIVHVGLADNALIRFEHLEELTLVGQTVDDLLTSTFIFTNLKRLKLIGVKESRFTTKIREWNETFFPHHYFPSLERVTFLEREHVMVDESESDFHMFRDVKVERVVLLKS
jgi:hypothetical protein